MEFWGVEVKHGEPLKVTPKSGKLIHISQAALGEAKDVEGAKYVPLRLKVGSENFIIGSLSAEDRTQVMFDLVFEKKFELSHDWKNGSVYFIGYVADDPLSDDEGFPDEFSDESEEEEEPVKAVENGKTKPKSDDVKAAKAAVIKAAKAAAAKVEIKKEEESDSDEDDDVDLSSDEEMALLAEDSSDVSGDDSEDDEDESPSDEELPKNVQQSKKRPAAQETPVPAKKAKAATPDKTGNKKGHTGTPFPSKGAGKGSAGNKSQGQTPKSGGHSKPFNNNKAQKSYNKGKRGGK